MQLIAESYHLLKGAGHSNLEIADFFDSLKNINQTSYLIEITSEILRKKNGEEFTIDLIKPLANNKGTGRLTIETSFEIGVSAPSIYAAYDARVQSNADDFWKTKSRKRIEDNKDIFDHSEKISLQTSLAKSLYFGRVAAMIQGLTIIEKYNEINNFSCNFGDIFKNWSGGCIIRSEMLYEFMEINNVSDNLLHSIQLHDLLKKNLNNIKEIVSSSMLKNISLPVFSSSLSWYLNLSAEDNPSNLIQAQRDFFGSHTVQLVNSNKYIHIDWREDE